MAMQVRRVATQPFAGQKPGTSGLRKKVVEVMQEHYLANFVQSVFDVLKETGELTHGQTLVVGGDGRYYNKEAVQLILKLSAANGVGKVWVGQNAILSTPAVSVIIRERENNVAMGGLILTASHNAGGPTQDFGIKYNAHNGGPALEDFTNKVYERTLRIAEYEMVDLPEVDLAQLGEQSFAVADGHFTVQIIDNTEDYVRKMQQLFDFPAISRFGARGDFKLHYDCLSGVAGPYVRKIFHELLGAPLERLHNSEPLEDFGGKHPDPNLVYAHDLVEAMGLGHRHEGDFPEFGAANDGDADRNMVLGKKFFVTPSDSVAVIAANYQAIPYFRSGLKGVARSMPTSCALDKVAEKLGLHVYEVPTGWKFFGNLMDAGMLSLCGEESFGTGSDHIREKDGVWAVLAWMSILAHKNEGTTTLVTVEDIVKAHWREFGRNYYMRYDYEGVDSDKANQLMATLQAKFTQFPEGTADVYEYTDPVDHSVSKNQGLRFVTPTWRVVYRLSGTGSVGATVRVYYEKYEREQVDLTTDVALGEVIAWSLQFADINATLGRDAPTVIT